MDVSKIKSEGVSNRQFYREFVVQKRTHKNERGKCKIYVKPLKLVIGKSFKNSQF